MKTQFAVTAILAGTMLLAACDTAKKTGADAAIKTAQTAYSAIADQAKTYAPDQAAAVQASIQSAKDAYDKGDYSAAFDAAKELPGKIQDLSKAISAKKDELTAKWNELSSSMPGMVSAVQTKMDALTKSHRVPKGAADMFASVKQTWADASSSFTSGQIPDALAKASAAKQKLVDLEASLGMKPAA
jgi:hypothetical protein